MRNNLILSCVTLALLSACSSEPTKSAAASPIAQPIELDLTRLEGREVHEPQFLLDEGGTLLLVWREKGEEGSDLYVARRGEGSQLGAEVSINDEPATVAPYSHDEMRAAIAAGPNGRVGVAWSDSRGQVRAAVSSDGAASFAPSIRLEQTETAAYRGFPAIAFDDSGVLHAVWIDSRYAGGFAEEPADLYYARVVDGIATESNLTAEQEATVCGCCRTHMEITSAGVPRALFRNATADGYRDIFTVSGTETGMSTPELVGQPLWELRGCPMSGPIEVANRVLWPDGSSGRKLLMVAPFGDEPAATLFSEEQRGDWQPRLSPRAVISNQLSSPLLLLPGLPSSRLVAAGEGGNQWTIAADDLPRWATSALYEDGVLLLIGSISGEFRVERRPFEI